MKTFQILQFLKSKVGISRLRTPQPDTEVPWWRAAGRRGVGRQGLTPEPDTGLRRTTEPSDARGLGAKRRGVHVGRRRPVL